MKFKKIIATAVVLALVLCSNSAVFAATAPTDIEATSCEAAVNALVKAGAITGDTDGLFHPEDGLTRAQACIIIVKTINPLASTVNGTATQAGAKSNFSDLKGYSWAAGYIGYAVENGIVKGYPDGTFKPGNKVTSNEMLTMVLRASKYSEGEIGANWPTDYITKATEVGILNGIEADYPETATKGMAAQMTFNQMEKLQTPVPTAESKPQGTDLDKPKTAPTTSNMAFALASFDKNMSAFGGKTISKNVTIYTYGAKADYTEKMVLSTKADDYRLDTLHKFKAIKTPAWYTVENNEITSMILPRDVSFKGQAYVVINGTANVTNLANESVVGMKTLTAANGVTWLCKKDLVLPTFANGDGQLYELVIADAVVNNVATMTHAKGDKFAELTTDHAWTDVYSYNGSMIRLTNETGVSFSVKSKASIYVWDAKAKEYKEGTVTSISDSKKVRAYDISDDNDAAADIVILTDK